MLGKKGAPGGPPTMRHGLFPSTQRRPTARELRGVPAELPEQVRFVLRLRLGMRTLELPAKEVLPGV